MGMNPGDDVCPICQKEVVSSKTHLVQSQLQTIVKGDDFEQWEHLHRYRGEMPPITVKVCMPCVERSFLYWLDCQDVEPKWAIEIRKKAEERKEKE